MRKEIPYNEDLQDILTQLPKGAFLTVKNGDEVNTMTIGWASFGVIWNKPILMVAVRKTRETFRLIDNSKDFTVSVPIDVDLKKQLAYCGTYSGRDVDKIEKCKLTLKKGNKVNSPVIADCDYHYECRIVFSQFMDSDTLIEELKAKYYLDDNYHMLYFGEIVDSYKLLP